MLTSHHTYHQLTSYCIYHPTTNSPPAMPPTPPPAMHPAPPHTTPTTNSPPTTPAVISPPTTPTTISPPTTPTTISPPTMPTTISPPTTPTTISPPTTPTTISPPTMLNTSSSTSSPLSASINLPTSNQSTAIVASVVVICAVAVVAAIVIIILIYKGVLRRRRTPTRPATDGLDNVIYNGSCTTVAAGSIYATYEPLNDKQETSSHVNYDYLEEDCNPYITPASHEEELYMQLESKKLKKIPRHQIEANEMLGSGQFGGVQIGIWNGSKGRCEVAIKTLNPTTTQPDAKVKFLQEAAIMVQFRHPNIIQLYGIVLDGEPITLVLELANKKDLRTHLGTMRPEYVCGWIGTRMITIYPSPGQMLQPDLPLRLLNYSKQTAAGMKYLSSKSFVHRDLAARNILVTKDCICKIADFGLSRDLADDTYYVSHGGMVPIKWTAPEAIHFKKYSTASDVWSYGCLLYEIWSMGVKPFEEKSNAEVVQKVDSGYRLPPPPGCPQLIYQLMIQCWNPATHSRPLFKDIYQSLCQSEELVLAIPCDVHLIHPNAGMVGASLEAGQNLYIELQKSYLQV
ncbi:hypothetical protein EMCRGX_G016145 [Ephydatia muelleri]